MVSKNVQMYKYIQNLNHCYNNNSNNCQSNDCDFDCNNKKFVKKYNHKKSRFWFKFLIAIIIILLFIIGYLYFFVNPQIINGHKAQIKTFSVNLINNAVATTINNNEYDDLITITKNSNGNISLLSVNSKNVNILTNSVMSLVQSKLNQQDTLNYKLPLGTFTGLPILSGIGPNVTLKIVPVGSVATKYRSQISSLSINQSYHKIYLTVSVSLCVFLPLYTQYIDVSSQILIAENLIVGQIPTTYLNTDNLTNALNLIP